MDTCLRIGNRLLPALLALLVAVAGPVAAQGDAAAGRFIVVTGEVRILGRDGATRDAQRNGEIRQGESIITGANSLAQLRMSDGGAVSVRADTLLKFDVYRFSGSDDRDGGFFVSLVKGGFRTITGLIARNNRQNYRIATASATIGVRGTHFEVVHVLQPISDAAAGTYNRVYDGITTFQNRAGASVLVSREQTAFVALPSNLPPVLVAPPIGIFGKPTPVPQLTPQSRREGEGSSAEGVKPAAPRVAREAPDTIEKAPAQTVAPARVLTAPLLNPIDTPRVLDVAPTTTTISPTFGSPTTTTISPTLVAPKTTTISPTLTSPTTTTISPTLISPTTTTISPILTSPTTTISPVMTAPPSTISPVLTAPPSTISPVLTAPTTTISPILTAPTTTIQTAPTTSTIIRR